MKNPFFSNFCFPGITLMIILIAVSCQRSEHKADAFGNFEADEVIVSAQSQGNLIRLEVTEGVILEKGQVVGKIDSAVPAFKVSQLKAQQLVHQSKLQNMDAQLNVQQEQRINMDREVKRIENLMESAAATRQQYDDLSGKLKVLDLQTEIIKGQKNTILAERSVLNAQLSEAENLLQKCTIINPLNGVVLEKYAEAGELVTPGKALYKIANISELELKVFVDGSQLSAIEIGDSANVFIDSRDNTMQSMPGIINWVSPQAEFTPKIIQTREERINMVYAVKVRVKNDGRLKIGMPGEVIFGK
jgi:HlyD family secretion protein